MTIGMPDSPRMARQISMPLIPGSIRSSRTISGRASRNAAIARSPSATKDGRKPSLRSTMPSISARAGSSSTTSTRALMRPIFHPAARIREPGLRTIFPHGQTTLNLSGPHAGAGTCQDGAATVCPWRSSRGAGVRSEVVPLSPLALAEILDAAVELLRRHAARLVGLGAALAVGEQALLYPLRGVAAVSPPLYWPHLNRLAAYWVLLAVGMGTEVGIIAVLGGIAARRLAPGPRRLGGLTVLAVVVALGGALTAAAGFLPWIIWYVFTGLAAPAIGDPVGPGLPVLLLLLLAGLTGAGWCFWPRWVPSRRSGRGDRERTGRRGWRWPRLRWPRWRFRWPWRRRPKATGGAEPQ